MVAGNVFVLVSVVGLVDCFLDELVEVGFWIGSLRFGC